MNTNIKKAILIFGGGLIVYWAFKKIMPIGGKKKIKKKEESAPPADKKNAVIALRAYSEAKKAGESKQFLDDMNLEFSKQYNLKVYTDKGSGKLFAADLDGNKII